MPTVGAVFAVTATFNVVSLNSVALSVARKVKLAFVAVQEVTISAVTTPAALTAMFESVTPLTVWLAAPPTVTANVVRAWSA